MFCSLCLNDRISVLQALFAFAVDGQTFRLFHVHVDVSAVKDNRQTAYHLSDPSHAEYILQVNLQLQFQIFHHLNSKLRFLHVTDAQLYRIFEEPKDNLLSKVLFVQSVV